jgi:hypothetical protein
LQIGIESALQRLCGVGYPVTLSVHRAVCGIGN